MMAIDDESAGGVADIGGIDCWWWQLYCIVEVMVMLDGTDVGGVKEFFLACACISLDGVGKEWCCDVA